MLATPVPLAEVDQAVGVCLDIDSEPMCCASECTPVRIVDLQRVHVLLENLDRCFSTMLIAMPEQPLDALKGAQQALTGGFVMMGNAARILLRHGHTHGNKEPVEDVLGLRGD